MSLNFCGMFWQCLIYKAMLLWPLTFWLKDKENFFVANPLQMTWLFSSWEALDLQYNHLIKVEDGIPEDSHSFRLTMTSFSRSQRLNFSHILPTLAIDCPFFPFQSMQENKCYHFDLIQGHRHHKFLHGKFFGLVRIYVVIPIYAMKGYLEYPPRCSHTIK